jgi:subtilisin family serine protease/archaellum component FlaF (FlaF/FlaG flagellin family)
MRLTPRRITVGLVSTAVVVTLTGVSTWALADDGSTGPASKPPVRLVIGYKDGASTTTVDQTMSAMGASRTATAAGQQALDALHATTVQVPAGRSASLIASLKNDPNVAYVQVDHVRQAYDVTPNDPFYTDGLQPELQEVKVPTAWDTTTGSAVTIAVVDTGVTPAGDLLTSGKVLAGYNFVSNNTNTNDDLVENDGTVVGHGTTVASLIAATTNNDAGMAGVCWACTILPVKVLNNKGIGNDSNIAKGVVWAVQHGAKIINMSLGGTATSPVLSDAIAYANMNSVLVVAAAGNGQTSTRSYPAAYLDVVAVGATARNSDARASFSNFNGTKDKWVDVAAPGIVAGMDAQGNVNTGQEGTSFAAPIVSGIAGLIKSAHPTYTGWSLMQAIQQGAKTHPVPDGWATYGEVNAVASLSYVPETVPPTSTGISPAQNAKVHGAVTVTPVKLADNISGIRNVTLYVDGVYKGYSRTSPFSIKWNSAGRNGTAKLQLRIFDKAGNHTYLDRTVIADNTAPAVKITKAPKSGSKIKGTVKIYYTGSDKYGVKNYQLLINGKVVQTHTSTKSPFAFSASKYPKKITVQVRATDNAGNTKLSAKYSYHR